LLPFHQEILGKKNFSIPFLSYLAPVIDEFPVDTFATVGESVVFQVLVTGRPNPDIFWFHDNIEISYDSTQIILADGSLSLPSVTLKEGGEYVLTAFNSVGRTERVVKLTVQNPTEKEDIRKEDGWRAGQVVAPIPVRDFRTYVAKHRADSYLGLLDQFQVCGKKHEL
jgi:hypothetical protein